MLFHVPNQLILGELETFTDIQLGHVNSSCQDTLLRVAILSGCWLVTMLLLLLLLLHDMSLSTSSAHASCSNPYSRTRALLRSRLHRENHEGYLFFHRQSFITSAQENKRKPQRGSLILCQKNWRMKFGLRSFFFLLLKLHDNYQVAEYFNVIEKK